MNLPVIQEGAHPRKVRRCRIARVRFACLAWFRRSCFCFSRAFLARVRGCRWGDEVLPENHGDELQFRQNLLAYFLRILERAGWTAGSDNDKGRLRGLRNQGAVRNSKVSEISLSLRLAHIYPPLARQRSCACSGDMVAHTPPKWNERPERLLPGGGLHGPGGSGEEDMSMISSVTGMAARNSHDSRPLTSRRMSARDRVWLKSHAPMHPNNKFTRRLRDFELYSITASMRTRQQ